MVKILLSLSAFSVFFIFSICLALPAASWGAGITASDMMEIQVQRVEMQRQAILSPIPAQGASAPTAEKGDDDDDEHQPQAKSQTTYPSSTPVQRVIIK